MASLVEKNVNSSVIDLSYVYLVSILAKKNPIFDSQFKKIIHSLLKSYISLQNSNYLSILAKL